MSGATYGNVLQFIAEEWGLKNRQSETYITEARKEIQKSIQSQISYTLESGVSIYDTIIERALIEGEIRYSAKGEPYKVYDLAVAKSANTEKLKLLGMFRNTVEIVDARDKSLKDCDDDYLLSAIDDGEVVE